MGQALSIPAVDRPDNEGTITRRSRSNIASESPSIANAAKVRSTIRVFLIAPYREAWQKEKYVIADVTESLQNPPKHCKVSTALLLDASDVVAGRGGIRYHMEEKDGSCYWIRNHRQKVAFRRRRTILHPRRIIEYVDQSKPYAHVKHKSRRPFVQEGAKFKWTRDRSIAKLRKYDSNGKRVVGETYMPSIWSGRLLVFDEREVDEVAVLYSTYLVDRGSRYEPVSCEGSVMIPNEGAPDHG